MVDVTLILMHALRLWRSFITAPEIATARGHVSGLHITSPTCRSAREVLQSPVFGE